MISKKSVILSTKWVVSNQKDAERIVMLGHYNEEEQLVKISIHNEGKSIEEIGNGELGHLIYGAYFDFPKCSFTSEKLIEDETIMNTFNGKMESLRANFLDLKAVKKKEKYYFTTKQKSFVRMYKEIKI